MNEAVFICIYHGATGNAASDARSRTPFKNLTNSASVPRNKPGTSGAAALPVPIMLN